MNEDRCLDVEVAKKIFRWIVILDTEKGGEPNIIYAQNKHQAPVPFFSTNNDDAYKIINRFQKENYFVYINSRSMGDGSSEWSVAFHKKDQKIIPSKAKTFSYAVCLAALFTIK
mgnify:CR=1 FL=1